MSDVLTGRLLVAAVVWAGLVTLGSPGAVTAASLAGTLVGSVLLAVVVKQAWQKVRAARASRATA